MASTRSIFKSLLGIGMVALLSATGLAVSPSAAAASTIVVGTQSATCPNPQHATIQAAVNAASAGDTIRVCAGTYNEAVTVNKSLFIRGAQAGVDARTGRTNPARESIVQPPGGSNGFTVDSGAGNVTIDGFTVQNSTLSGIDTLNGGSGYTIVNNIVTGNHLGMAFRSPGTASSPSAIRFNRIQNNNVGAGGGTGVFLGGTQGTDFTSISSNRFSGHVSTDINTQGVLAGTDPAEALTISSNTSVDSATFLVLLHANSPSVTANQVTKNAALPSGSAMLIDSRTDNAQIRSNQITGGVGTGINVTALFGITPAPSTNLNVTGNVVRSRTNGMRVAALSSGRFSGNVISGSSNDGILVESSVTPTTPLVFSGNVSQTSSVWDAEDDTTGGGTAGTANTWSGNVCPKDSPNGICV
jgi:hypothetical protein